METLEIMLSRRSVRYYRPDPVPRELIETLATAALWAPSASNRQETVLVAVTDPDDLRRLQPFAPGMRGNPPAVLVAACDRSRLPAPFSDPDPGGAGSGLLPVVHMDVAMAVQNILLAAHAAGLGACAIHSFRPGAVAGLLNLPTHIVPVLLVALGWPSRPPGHRNRRPLSEALLWGRQETDAPADLPSAALTSDASPRPAFTGPPTAAAPAADGTNLVTWLLSSARGLMDEPLRYGPTRLLDAACNAIQFLQRHGLAEEQVSRQLDRLVRQRDKGSPGYDQLGETLDGVLTELARGK